MALYSDVLWEALRLISCLVSWRNTKWTFVVCFEVVSLVRVLSWGSIDSYLHQKSLVEQLQGPRRLNINGFPRLLNAVLTAAW